MSMSGGFPYKLHLCLKDDPGSFIRVFASLLNDDALLFLARNDRIASKIVDFHSLSLVSCTRFSKLPEPFARIVIDERNKSLTIIKKYKFHTIMFILEKNSSNNRKTIKGIYEIHACFRDRPLNNITAEPFVLDKLVGLIMLLYKAYDKNFYANINIGHTGKELKRTEKWDNEFKALLIAAPRKKISDSLKKRRKLLEMIYKGNEVTQQAHNAGGRNIGHLRACIMRGTCPIAHACMSIDTARHGFRHLLADIYKYSIICEQNIVPDSNNDEKDESEYVCDAYYIRDHEDYTPERTYMEIYGNCYSKKKKDNSARIENQKMTNVLDKYIKEFAEAANSIVITELIGSPNLDTENLIEDIVNTLNNSVKNLNQQSNGHGDKYFLLYKINRNKNKSYVIINKYFSCDELKCDINRKIMNVPDITFNQVMDNELNQ